MIKRHFLLISLLSIFIGTHARAGELILKLNFLPKYLDTSEVKVEKTVKGYFMQLTTDNLSDSAYINQDAIDEINDFFSKYRSPLDKTSSILKVHVDGIYMNGNVVRQIAFNRPDKGNINHELMKILFTILYDRMQLPEAIVYLENLEQQFDFGLGLKTLAEDPLTFKLYGSVTAKESNSFYAFITSLPIDRPVRIDMSNFKSMGRLYYPTIVQISAQNKDLHWINCSPQALLNLGRAGVRKSQVFE